MKWYPRLAFALPRWRKHPPSESQLEGFWQSSLSEARWANELLCVVIKNHSLGLQSQETVKEPSMEAYTGSKGRVQNSYTNEQRAGRSLALSLCSSVVPCTDKTVNKSNHLNWKWTKKAKRNPAHGFCSLASPHWEVLMAQLARPFQTQPAARILVA